MPESGQIGSPKVEQFGFSHIDGSPIASGGRALTPHSGQIGDVLESLYKQICESRHSGDTTNLGGWGAYGVNAAVARHPGLAGAAAMGGLGPQVRHDRGGGVGGGLQFGYDALSGLGVTGKGTGGVSNGAGRSQLEALYHQAK